LDVMWRVPESLRQAGPQAPQPTAGQAEGQASHDSCNHVYKISVFMLEISTFYFVFERIWGLPELFTTEIVINSVKMLTIQLNFLFYCPFTRCNHVILSRGYSLA
jgi:hypothetical protein